MVEAIRQGDIPGVQLRWRRQLAADAERVRRWLAEADKLARWLAEEVELDPAGGLKLGGDFEGERLEERGTTLERSGASWRLAFRRRGAGWEADTVLTLAVTRRPEGCEVMVFQEGFQRLPLSIGLTEWERYRRRWRAAGERLAAALEAAQG